MLTFNQRLDRIVNQGLPASAKPQARARQRARILQDGQRREQIWRQVRREFAAALKKERA